MAIGTKYSGIWTKSQQMRAVAAGTWKNIPLPSLFVWGTNASGTGELGLLLGPYEKRSSPTQIGTATDWASVGFGQYASFAIKTTGSLWSWGYNASGVLGQNTAGGSSTSSPVQVGSGTNWYQVGNFDSNAYALRTDGTMWSWGDGSNTGNTGQNSTYVSLSSPTQIGTLTTWSFVDAGQGGLAVKNDSTLWMWGRNQSGTLGLGTSGAYTHRSSPVQIGGTGWASGSRTYTFTAAVKTDGTLWVWGGAASSGVYGNNTTGPNVYSPVQTGSSSDWAMVSVGPYMVSAIKTNGTLWSWGSGTYGSLGDNTTVSKSSPVQIGAETNWYKVSRSKTYYSCMAIKTDGTLWAWGANGSGGPGANYAGLLGTNNTITQSSPVQVGTLTGWSAISVGANHAGGVIGLLS